LKLKAEDFVFPGEVSSKLQSNLAMEMILCRIQQELDHLPALANRDLRWHTVSATRRAASLSR